MKTPSQLISLDFGVSWLHVRGMKILLMTVVVQFLALVVFAWFNRVAWIRILVLSQQLAVYKRKSKKVMLRNRDRLFWSLLSRIWRDWRSELILHGTTAAAYIKDWTAYRILIQCWLRRSQRATDLWRSLR